MTTAITITRAYVILQPAVAIPEDKRAVSKAIIYIPLPPESGLLYVEPEQLSTGLPSLGELQPRGVVIPDYVFWNLITQSNALKFQILDVDFSADGLADSLYKPNARRLIEAAKSNTDANQDLVSFLENLKLPITTIEFRAEQIPDAEHTIKLYGSGLIRIRGNEEAIEDGVKQFLERLTDFLVHTYLKPIHSETHTAAHSAEETASV